MWEKGPSFGGSVVVTDKRETILGQQVNTSKEALVVLSAVDAEQ